ncbi:MAG TPA: YciI family protein [Spirochaetia bacterium]|nr:YciI family protein [Spirochaetia bacterium]
MKDYIFLFRGGLDFRTASPEQLQKAMQKWQLWMDRLAKDGKLSSSGNRLNGTGSVIRGNKKEVFEGPYVEGKEIVGGYMGVKAASLEEAIEIGKGCPIFDFGGSTEVREVVAM